MTGDTMSDRATNVLLIARLAARPGKEEALIAAISEAVPLVLREEGCLSYLAHISAEAPNTVVMYEVWADKAALDAHAAGPNFTKLASRFDELLNEPLGIEMLRRI